MHEGKAGSDLSTWMHLDASSAYRLGLAPLRRDLRTVLPQPHRGSHPYHCPERRVQGRLYDGKQDDPPLWRLPVGRHVTEIRSDHGPQRLCEARNVEWLQKWAASLSEVPTGLLWLC